MLEKCFNLRPTLLMSSQVLTGSVSQNFNSVLSKIASLIWKRYEIYQFLKFNFNFIYIGTFEGRIDKDVQLAVLVRLNCFEQIFDFLVILVIALDRNALTTAPLNLYTRQFTYPVIKLN